MLSFIVDIYNTVFYDPIFEALVFFYQNLSFSSLGLAIIFLTIVIRVVLFPLFYKSAKSQALMQKIRPRIQEIKEEHEDDKEKQAEELMKLYKKYGFNPFSSFLVILIQLPIFIALFRIFRNSDLLVETFSHMNFLGLVNLSSSSFILALAVAALQYFQSKASMSGNSGNDSSGSSPMANFSSKFKYILPFISFVVLINLPSALALYWGTSTLFSLGQQKIINKKIEEKDFPDPEEEESVQQSADSKDN